MILQLLNFMHYFICVNKCFVRTLRELLIKLYLLLMGRLMCCSISHELAAAYSLSNTWMNLLIPILLQIKPIQNWLRLIILEPIFGNICYFTFWNHNFDGFALFVFVLWNYNKLMVVWILLRHICRILILLRCLFLYILHKQRMSLTVSAGGGFEFTFASDIKVA